MNILNIVLGYGVPENIMEDVAYTTYLTVAFNRMYAQAQRAQVQEPRVILCGGPTDINGGMQTEAAEMKRWFLQHMQTHKISGWHCYTEEQSLSTLENLMFAKRVIAAKHLSFHELHVYCEQTRVWRVSQLIEGLFKGVSYDVQGVDFDASARRYSGLDALLHQELLVCNHDLWALQDQEHFKAHHKLYEQKMHILREKGPHDMEEAQKEWNDVFLKATGHLR